jgi:hypothetical protein
VTTGRVITLYRKAWVVRGRSPEGNNWLSWVSKTECELWGQIREESIASRDPALRETLQNAPLRM